MALQLGTRDGWTAFLGQYPDGFYANLAKGQLNKIAAEETRAVAADKARQAEEEKARLASERAKKAEQNKAAAAAKAAENARLAAEKAKQVEEAKAAAAEQRRTEAEAAVATAQADKQAAEKARLDSEQKVAAVAPTQTSPGLSPQETAKLVQSELRRVGCLTGAVDGDWNATSQRSLTLFNKHAGMKLDTTLASFDTLDAIKSKPGRVCPLVCDQGFRADGDTCVKIACRSGYRVNDDNECEKIQDKKPVATREDAKPRDTERKKSEAAPSKPQATGQIYCNSAGCRPVQKGCRLEFTRGVGGGGAASTNYEVCN